MVVCGTVFTAEIIARIRNAVESEPSISRRSLARRVCDWLGWMDVTGKAKTMSCRVALQTLQRRGVIDLPEPTVKASVFAVRKQLAPLEDSSPVACDLSQLGAVELVPVQKSSSGAWNALMAAHHYLGAGPLCGAQLRYFVNSSTYGCVGCLAFSAASWRLAARDRWIGWDDGTRCRNLHRIVCNSRFLILPTVRVKNLASHALSLAAARIAGDWQERYGYRPVLMETYVQKDRFTGSCYRAANWQSVGTTAGRGRQDGNHARAVPIKEVYVYPLSANAKRELCGDAPHPVVSSESLRTAPSDWAEEEFAQVALGDRRLNMRLISIARDFYSRPQASVPQACQSRAKTKAAYRFFDHPEATMDTLLHQHYEATVARMAREKVVLAVQDTTTLDYSTHPATENLGPLAWSANGLIGMLLHDTMAFNLDGTPLGLIDARCWTRDPEDIGKKKRRHELPIEQKESYKWLQSYRKAAAAQRRCPDTTVVSVGDREADIYELFALALQDPAGAKLLVRAMHDRVLAQEQGRLWEKLLRQETCGILEVRVPRRGSVPTRVARLQVRFAEVLLQPPSRIEKLPELRVWAVLAQEQDAPANTKALEWMLLTSCSVSTFAEATEKLTWYALRWGIEVYHRTLKSGCKIEERQLGAVDRIEACLAIDMVVAWRIHHLTKLGREVPDVPCTVFFEEAEWKALCAYLTRSPIPPAQPPSLRDATRMVASLGGFLGRKGDGNPGTESLWIGLQRLDDMTSMWKVLTHYDAPHPPLPPVSSNPRYG